MASSPSATIASMASTMASMASTLIKSSNESMTSTVKPIASTIENMASTIVTMSGTIACIPSVVSDMASTIANMSATITNLAGTDYAKGQSIAVIASSIAAMSNTIASMLSGAPSPVPSSTIVSSSSINVSTATNTPLARESSSAESPKLQSSVPSTLTTATATTCSPTASPPTPTTCSIKCTCSPKPTVHNIPTTKPTLRVTAIHSSTSTSTLPTSPSTYTLPQSISVHLTPSCSVVTSLAQTKHTVISTPSTANMPSSTVTTNSSLTTLPSSSHSTGSTVSLWNGVRTIKILDSIGRTVLYDIFLWGTPKKSLSEHLDQYLSHLPEESTANYRKLSSVQRRFNKTDLQYMANDPSCASFDISLLWKCIKLACEDVAEASDPCWHTVSPQVSSDAKMECFVSGIKKCRNNVYHGTLEMSHSDFLQTAAELRFIFCGALSAAKQRYNRPDAELTSKTQWVQNNLDKIAQEILGENDLITFCGDRLMQDLAHEVNDSLKIQFQNAVNIDPMAFLVGVDLRLHVQKVFTNVRVRSGDRHGEGTLINYLDLVTVAKNDAKSGMPQVLLVEGLAGSGKTTLLTMVTDEWLKLEQDRSFRGLDQYDVLLKVQCRDRAITTFKCLLEKHVSSVFLKYRSLVLPLIKKCNVLILIDGLDEANEDSERLLTDILEEMKGVPSCTLLCTSRPERTSIFTSRIHSKFYISYIELLGIPESSREKFVRRYHEEIKRQAQGVQDTEALVQKVQELRGRELFMLPLNLVFLTWVYHHKPSAVTTTTTQSHLYHIVHQLSVEKLLDRLAHHPMTKARDRRDLESCIRECLKSIYHESILALAEEKLTLSKNAEDNIRTSCITQGIPPSELLSAFFCLKATRTYLGMQEQYSTPHLGMQEYYAALHIVSHSSMAKASGSVRDVLKVTLNALDINLSMFQNVLQHVAGLLHLLNYSVPEVVSVEVVDLLQESGVRCRTQWLDLVEDTGAAPMVLRRVAHHFMISSDGDEIVVTDGRIGSYTALLPHLPSECPIRVNITKVSEGLEELLRILTRHTCKWLFLHPFYRDPEEEVTFNDTLKLLLPRSNMKVFLGQLSPEGVVCLPASLENLALVFGGDEHSKALLRALREAHLPNLKHLKIHVPVKLVSPQCLGPLPNIDNVQPGEGVDLIISDVSDFDVDKASQVITGLQPPAGFRAITFPRTTTTGLGWRRLVKLLASAGAKIGAGIAVPDTSVNVDQKNELDNLAETTVGCDFWRVSEEILWP
ncbi:hypothetical protein O3P69_005075 [Scylla paramamosain]|uniref:NACHT domain-containing protein n=1 Tax=Scylla paramamosain TaxID=85552 RepID=A0AAW0U9U5_SCYPA